MSLATTTIGRYHHNRRYILIIVSIVQKITRRLYADESAGEGNQMGTRTTEQEWSDPTALTSQSHDIVWAGEDLR